MNVSNDQHSSFSKRQLTCNHCKKPGHTKSQCYRLIGFPANFKFTKGNKDDHQSTVQNAAVVSDNSSPTITTEQFQQILQMFSTHHLNSSGSTSHVNASVSNGAMHPEGNLFSFHHFCENVYKSSHLLHEHNSWIIDTGATDHMCSNKNLFISMTKLNQPHFIGLPNGNNTSVLYIGQVQLHDSIILRDVLTPH